MILIGGIVVKDTDRQSQWYTILGYIFLLGNTLCMVRYWCGCGALDHVISIGALCIAAKETGIYEEL